MLNRRFLSDVWFLSAHTLSSLITPGVTRSRQRSRLCESKERSLCHVDHTKLALSLINLIINFVSNNIYYILLVVCTIVVAFFENSSDSVFTLLCFCVINTGISIIPLSVQILIQSNIPLWKILLISDLPTERFQSTFNTVCVSLNNKKPSCR